MPLFLCHCKSVPNYVKICQKIIFWNTFFSNLDLNISDRFSFIIHVNSWISNFPQKLLNLVYKITFWNTVKKHWLILFHFLAIPNHICFNKIVLKNKVIIHVKKGWNSGMLKDAQKTIKMKKANLFKIIFFANSNLWKNSDWLRS